jgi:hypothetical protein
VIVEACWSFDSNRPWRQQTHQQKCIISLLFAFYLNWIFGFLKSCWISSIFAENFNFSSTKWLLAYFIVCWLHFHEPSTIIFTVVLQIKNLWNPYKKVYSKLLLTLNKTKCLKGYTAKTSISYMHNIYMKCIVFI